MLLVTPDQFASVASAWIGSFVIVAGALSVALIKLWPTITDLKTKIAELFAKHEANQASIKDNKEAIAAQQAQITYVALSTPPEKKG